jgi:hypothetical protein
MQEYASFLNDAGFNVKPLDLNEDYSHVKPSSGYKPNAVLSGQNENANPDLNDDDQMEERPERPGNPATPSKKRPRREDGNERDDEVTRRGLFG